MSGGISAGGRRGQLDGAGGREIAAATSKLMEQYDVAIWAHHGMFCSGEDFDLTFGLLHTVEKSAEILIKVYSVVPRKLQTITAENFRAVGEAFHVELQERFLFEKPDVKIGREMAGKQNGS